VRDNRGHLNGELLASAFSVGNPWRIVVCFNHLRARRQDQMKPVGSNAQHNASSMLQPT